MDCYNDVLCVCVFKIKYLLPVSLNLGGFESNAFIFRLHEWIDVEFRIVTSIPFHKLIDKGKKEF